MKHKMFTPFVAAESDRAVAEVLSSGYLNEGVQVSELARQVDEFLGGPPITLTNSGTSAIQIALMLSGVSKGDAVLTPSLTCVATSQAISWIGGVPFWIDVRPEHGCPSVDDVRSAISRCPSAKAVVVVSWGGFSPDLPAIRSLCQEHGMRLIHDAAHAFGSTIQGRSVSEFADFTCFSFQAIKHLTTGDGGGVVCLDADDHAKAQKAKWFGIDRYASKDESGEWKGQRWEMDVDQVGSKLHMNNIAAAVGLANMAYIADVIGRYRRNHEVLRGRLSEVLPSICSPVESARSACWVYTGILNGVDRDRVIEGIRSRGVDAGLVHVPNHQYSLYSESMISLPGTDWFHANQISLPCHHGLSFEDMNEIADIVLESI